INSYIVFEGNSDLWTERSYANNSVELNFTLEAPACVGGLAIDKRIVAPAANNIVPADNIVRYEVDLTYLASATQALDIARFRDVPTPVCNSDDLLCGEFDTINVVGCQVISGTATCPASFPIVDGEIDVSWGTANATTIANGAAFEPGSVVRITLEAQLANETFNLNELDNTASFASDPASPIFGSTLYAEDTELISVIAPDSMVINKQVTPTSVQPGDTVTYTVEVINNGPANGIGSVMTDVMAANLLADNPSGYQNISCAVISTTPPLRDPVTLADCSNVTITNNGTGGFVVNFTGNWLANSGYRFTFNVIAPAGEDSVENTAVLTPPPSSAAQRFNGEHDSTANFRLPPAADYGDLPTSFNAGDEPYHL
ncbi:MAG: DUF11 domain-containing protein, partial [Methylococcales bacterium]|nr:DUF11 domain-containing protein [Methylococcales bacterium]